MRTQWAQLTIRTLSFTLIFASAGCGGGISDALSSNDTSSSMNGISTSASEEASSAGQTALDVAAVTDRVFTECPNQEITPVSMNQVPCLVGRYEGFRADSKWNRIGPADEKCIATLMSNGQMTVSVENVVGHQHMISPTRYVAGPKLDFSLYRSLNRGSTDFSSYKTSPMIVLESQIHGAGSIQDADYFFLNLGQGANGLGGILTVWLLHSIVQDQELYCAGMVEASSQE